MGTVHRKCCLNQSRAMMRAAPGHWKRATRLHALLILATLVVAAAGCGGGKDRQEAMPDADFGPPPTIEASVPARPWASSKAAGQAFGRIWREKIRNPHDRDGRGVDAYGWAGRTCDAVRNGDQTPEAMVERVRDEGRFTQQGARIIVAAPLSALCPAQGVASQLLP
jgi:hypothetical protein